MENSLQQAREVVVDFKNLAFDANIATWNPSLSTALEVMTDLVLQPAEQTDRATASPPEARRNSPKRVKVGHKRSRSPKDESRAALIDGTIHHERDWLSSFPAPEVRGPPMGYEFSYEAEPTPEVEQNLLGPLDNVAAWANSVGILPMRTQGHTAIFTEGWMPTIGKELKPPAAYQMAETSFARRFLRYCYERTLNILTDPRSPPEEVHRILRFSLCFGSVRMIAERIKYKLMQPGNEPLEMWDLPSPHIGGAGHHFQREGIDNTTPPPQGFAADRNVGPFDFRGSTKVPLELYPYQVAQWLGIEGVWFDGYDLEQYLRTKGLYLDGWSAIASVEVDDDGYPTTSNDGLSSPNGASTLTNSSPQSPLSPDEVVQDFFSPSVDQVLANTSPDMDFSINAQMDLDPSGYTVGTPSKSEMNLFPALGSGAMLNSALPNQVGQPRRRRVAIDVEKLIAGKRTSTVSYVELTGALGLHRETICLGRSPGIRQDGVDKALRSIIEESFEI